jgi:UDP:flavonoid glycosyltransferase YjiC (YdhE family)
LVALPLPPVDGFPEGAESTNDISPDMLELHWMASDGLAAPFSQFLDAACASTTKKPDWVIVDTFPYWAVTAAAKHKIPCAGLLLCSASMVAPGAGGGRPINTTLTTRGASGLSLKERVDMTLQGCQLVALRSCLELETESVTTALINGVRGKPFVPLGLLPPSPRTEEDDDVRRWLDAQPPKSVVYIALGSEAQLRVEQAREMALGLELAGTRFLWVLRNPSAADILPPGFMERTRGRGLVAMGWVSQLSVLAHDAVAAFLTHCGWGSTIEGLLYGHPLIMLPFIADQWPIAAQMEGKQVGVQVARNGDDGSFDREAVAMAIRAVTADQDGVFTANAKKLQKIVADREYHERCVDGFIQQLRSTTVE